MTTTTTTPRRAEDRMRAVPARTRLRGAGAVVVLLALLVGVPVLLAAVIGNPLPQQVPTAHALQRLLARPLSDNAVVRILAMLAWLAWASLGVNVAREAWSQLHGLPSPRRLPLLSLQQGFAHHLVATALLLLPAAANLHAAPMSSLTRAVGEPYPAGRPVAAMTLTVDSPLDQPKAERILRETPEAAIAHMPAQPATPQRPHKVYVVAPPHGRHYDSLWDIAERHLGDGRRYREIYELNRGRPQPDGSELTRASLIQPGWVLLLPDDATGPGVRDVTGTTAPHADHSAPASTVYHFQDPSGASPDAQPAMPAPAPRSPGETTWPATTPTSTSERDKGDAHPVASHRTHLPVVPIGLGVGSLAAIAALQRARRIALRNRPIGRRPAPTPADLLPVEAGLRREAKRVDPLAATLRLAIALAGQRRPTAGVGAVLRHDDGQIELLLREPVPAAPPFAATERGWQLPANAAGFAFAVDDADPLPALLQLGRHDDAEVYIDIEAAGYTAVDGDPPAVEDLLATCAARLVGATWAELTHVMIPARIGARVGALEHVEVVDDIAVRTEEILRYASTVKAQLVDAGFDSVAAARGGGPADAMAVLTLVGWRQDELPDELAEAAVDPAVPLLVLASGADERAGQQWRLTDEVLSGTAHTDPVTVAARPPAADQVAVLIEHVRTAEAVAPTHTSYVQLHEDAPPAPATEPAAPVMSIDLLGPVELTGITMPRRTPAFQTLVYLALHRRGVTAEQLSTALWPDELAASKTIRNRVAEARAVVEGAISDGPGWRLDESISSDWQRFQTLAAGTAEQQLAALDLVRGQPFDGFTDEWVDLEMFRTDMVAAVIDLAFMVAERALDNDEPAVAYRASRVGLRASPYEERLFRLAMRAADAEGSTGKLRALMNEAQQILDVQIEPDDRMQRETIALYEELTSAAHRRERVRAQQ